MATFIQSRFEPLEGSAINAGTDRRAMACPEHYTPTRDEAPAAIYRRLAGTTPAELARFVEDPTASLVFRVTAGRLLALVGDPRIDPFAPKMIEIAGAQAALGLEPENVGRVVSSLAGTGALPEWIAKECPLHKVALKHYRLARYPVTNLEFREFLSDTRFAELPTSWEFGRYPHEKANHPVYTVSEHAADCYAAWLAVRTGRRFRLPCEAEWEFAAAGPDRREYPWGNFFRPAFANTLECGLLCSTPVGAFPAGNSPFGICDMAGNVEEYVADLYRPYPGATLAVEDDLARSLGRYRVARGGSFTRFRDLARCKRRHGRYPKPIYVMGFRLAEDI